MGGGAGSLIGGKKGAAIGAALEGTASAFVGIAPIGSSSVLSRNPIKISSPKFDLSHNNGCTFISLIAEASGGSINASTLKSLVPNNNLNTFNPKPNIESGFKYPSLVLGNKNFLLKWHSPQTDAPPESNSAKGWTAQLKVGNKYLNTEGKLQKNNQTNNTHIPVNMEK